MHCDVKKPNAKQYKCSFHWMGQEFLSEKNQSTSGLALYVSGLFRIC